MIGEVDVCAFTNPESNSFRSLLSKCIPVFKFFFQSPWVDDHPISKNQLTIRIGNPAWEVIEFQCSISDDNGVSRIISTLEPSHPTGLTRQLINHLPLALISPLGSQHHRGRHEPDALQTLHELAHDEMG